MQMRHAIFVQLELMVLFVKREFAAADTVGAAAGGRAEVGRIKGIAVEIVKAELQRSVMSLKAQILDDRTPGHNLGRQPAALDLDAIDGLARLRLPENIPLQLIRHHRPSILSRLPIPHRNRFRNFSDSNCCSVLARLTKTRGRCGVPDRNLPAFVPNRNRAE